MTGPISISAKGTRVIVFLKSVLTGLQVAAGASILGDLIGAKPAAFFIIAVAAVQAGVDYYASRTVSDAMTHVNSVVERAEAVTQTAGEAVHEMGATARAIVDSSVSKPRK